MYIKCNWIKKIYTSNTCDGFLASNAELWAYAISPNPVVWVIPNILALPTDLSMRGPLKYFIIHIYIYTNTNFLHLQFYF